MVNRYDAGKLQQEYEDRPRYFSIKGNNPKHIHPDVPKQKDTPTISNSDLEEAKRPAKHEACQRDAINGVSISMVYRGAPWRKLER